MTNSLHDPKRPLKLKDETSVSKEFEVEELTAILKTLDEYCVSEFELERDGLKLRLKRGGESIPGSAAPSGMQVSNFERTSMPTTYLEPGEVRRDQALSVVEGKKKESESFHQIKSPMVGTFYRRPSIDAKPYVEVGDVVKVGTVLCIVEAMKLMNEIESDISGRITEICLEDGQMAEYGEVLFRIEAGAS